MIIYITYAQIEIMEEHEDDQMKNAAAKRRKGVYYPKAGMVTTITSVFLRLLRSASPERNVTDAPAGSTTV